MNYAVIKKTDTANGPGVRVSLFVSGCTHHCKGCFNSETWDFNYGMPYTEETENEIIDALSPAYIRGLSLLGGEPLEPANRTVLLGLLKRVRSLYPHKDVWCYTGYDFEKDLLVWMEEGRADVEELLSLIDVLVDGEFVEEKKNLRLAFRGSENQRLLDVPASLKDRRAIIKRDE